MSTGGDGTYGGPYGGGSPPLVPPVQNRRQGNRPSRNALRDVVNVYRIQVPNLDVDGTQENVWNLLWANIACSVQVQSAERGIIQDEVRGTMVPCRIIFGVDPLVQIGDKIAWNDQSGVMHKFFVDAPAVNQCGRGTAYVVECTEPTV